MTWPETLLVCSAALLALAVWAPARLWRPSALGATVTAAVSVLVAVIADGPRWQWAPVLAGAVLAVAAAAVRLRAETRERTRTARKGRSALALTAAAAAAVMAGTGGAAMWALPVVSFPEPSGAFPVGTTTLQWEDRGREETWTRDEGDHRTVVAQLWYPAGSGAVHGEGAPYLGRTEEEAGIVAGGVADHLGAPGLLLADAARARTRAVADAGVAGGGRPFPVMVFSPGLGGVRGQNTVWAQEMASHGYVVAALDHPYDSAAVVLDDGTVVRSRLTVPDGPDEERLAREWTSIRAADMSLALTRLRDMAADADGPFGGRVDPGEAVAVGHSLGGAAAIEAARGDHRFTAVIDLDGFPRGTGSRPFPQPLLALVAGSGTGNARNDERYADALDLALRESTGPSCRVTVPGAAHLGFTDAPLYLPPAPSLVGSISRTELLDTTAQATLAFLGAVPGPSPADLRNALSPFGEPACVP